MHIGAAFAQSAIVVTPTFQEVVLSASDSATQANITIVNQTAQAQQFELFAVGISQIDESGNVMLSNKPLSGQNDPYSADIELPEPVITIAPNEEKKVPFLVKNSLNLSPGGHYVSLIVRAVSDDQQAASKQSVLPAISSFVLIRKLGGEQYNLFLKSLEFPQKRVWWKLPDRAILTFENQGNVHTTPRGQVTATDMFGRVVLEATINEGSQFVLPRSQRPIRVQMREIRRSVPLMLYTVSVSGVSEPGGVAFSQTRYVPYISVWLLLTTVVALLSVVGVIIYKKRAR